MRSVRWLVSDVEVQLRPVFVSFPGLSSVTVEILLQRRREALNYPELSAACLSGQAEHFQICLSIRCFSYVLPVMPLQFLVLRTTLPVCDHRNSQALVTKYFAYCTCSKSRGTHAKQLVSSAPRTSHRCTRTQNPRAFLSMSSGNVAM